MWWFKAVCLSVTVCAVVSGTDFPPGFKFGAATAAYQVEGAWNVSDKSESIWDTFVHNKPEGISNGSTGDVACDSYHQWRQDVEVASELGLNFYRFSISWTRLMPYALSYNISEDGKSYYSNLIDALLEKGIEPVVTLFHWDLPQTLQDLAYNTGALAPGIFSPGIGSYRCNKNAMLAHAKAYRIYDKEFRYKYNGKVSLSNHIIWFEPDTESDEEATQLARQFMAGMYSHPIYSKEGGWPEVIEKIVTEKSKAEGRWQSRLPPFTETEKELIRGLRKQLAWLKEEYGDIEILITENGASNSYFGLDDPDRLQIYRDNLEQLLLSINEDKVRVTGYTAWTMIDNFEWTDGYNTKFGLYQVDFEDPERKRTARDSAKFYASVIANHSLDISYEI